MLRIIFIIKSNLIGGVYMNIATIMSVVGVAIIVLAVRFIVKNVKK